MKIFFITPKFFKKLKGKNVFLAFICVVFLMLFTFQLVSRLKISVSPAMSESVVQSKFSVTLTARGTASKEGAMILLNGEEYAPLSDTSVSVELDRPSVIEIFCETDADFSVSAKASPGTTLIMKEASIKCKKGVNYICRCFFAD